jgi:hypothetical protein
MGKKIGFLILITGGIWGLNALWDYSNGPGLPALAKSLWPANTHLQREAQNPTFVMFTYPHCACSEASIAELRQILKKITLQMNVMIVFVTGKNPGNALKESTLWSEARLIPGAQIILDEGGVEAKRCGARTSGQVLLYDKQGKLVFSGGITSARGRLGDNPGKTNVISFMNQGYVKQSTSPVFGCVL